MAEFLLDTEREGHCPVCGDPLDPWGYAALGSLTFIDNISFGKCESCRKFVPDVTSLINFWKELND